MNPNINRREASAIVGSLTAGVVPRIGLRHIAVGRVNEVDAFLKDLQTIEEGGAAFRFVCGRYGSGKSFLLQLVRSNAIERDFVVMDADLSPERRLTGTNRRGLGTYRELMQHLSIKSRPDGGALESILQRWISSIQLDVAKEFNLNPTSPELIDKVSLRISEDLHGLSEMAYGFAFSSVLDTYWRAVKTGDEALKQKALRWLRGEYDTKTEAKRALPVDRIIDDANWYDFLKVFALFVHMAGYKGLVIFLDEGVNLFKITHKGARESNYEKILTIFNDTMQGKAKYIGVFISETPEAIYDERRGLFSYEALKSRLMNNRFSNEERIDYSSPVINLAQLKPEELFVLLERLCGVHGALHNYESALTEKELSEFLETVNSRLGTDKLLTPREVTRDFLGLLNILHQNPDTTFEELLADEENKVKSAESNPEELEGYESDDMFMDFDI